MTYQETIDFLFGIRLFGQKLGLETMRQLLRLMGDPQNSLRFIHIAGTNGKGSVAAMAHSVLTAAGYKTGLYTSPHLVSFCERFQINGQLINESEVVCLVDHVRPFLEAVGSHPQFRPPTFFEAVTAMALQYFREQNVEVVVWETGMGGRLDATNVVTPLVSVITNIGFDHMQHLGDTLDKIAYEKSGILKPGIAAVTAATEPVALRVITQTCAERGCPLTIIGEHIHAVRLGENLQSQHVRMTGTRRDYGLLELPLLGQQQAINCATALTALEAAGLEFSTQQARDGLRQTTWPGRFQLVNSRPTVVLDGAHNTEAAEILAASLREHFQHKKVALIIGVLRDKNLDEICLRLAPLAQHIICVPVNSERTADPQRLRSACLRANPQALISARVDLKEAYRDAQSFEPDVIVITGSLFLVGEALNRLGFPVRATAACERELVLQ